MSIVTPNIVPASVLLAEPRPAWLSQWGDFASRITFADLDNALIEQTKLVILDCIGAIAAGMQEPETQALVARLGRRNGGGSFSAIGAGRRLGPADAAFANGVAGTMLELDEGNQFARGHPGIHVLPAALAVRAPAETEGRAFLLAFILGYEIGARVGAASRLRNTLHPHGTWGTVGAAFAAAISTARARMSWSRQSTSPPRCRSAPVCVRCWRGRPPATAMPASRPATA